MMKKEIINQIEKEFGNQLVDLFIKIGRRKIDKKYQFRRIHSSIYDCEEYVWQGEVPSNSVISFVHADNRTIPNATIYNQISGPGITLSGPEACYDFKVEHALTCKVEGADMIYHFVDENSKLYYIGKSKKLTLFLRIYDNANGLNNDRWIVLFIE